MFRMMLWLQLNNDKLYSPSWDVEVLVVTQVAKESQEFYRIWRFITLFPGCLSVAPSLSQVNPVNILPNYFLQHILILSPPLSLSHTRAHDKVFHGISYLPPFFSKFCYEWTAMLFYAFCILRLSHPPQFHHPNNMWSVAWIMKLLITNFSPASCHFIPLSTSYSYTLQCSLPLT